MNQDELVEQYRLSDEEQKDCFKEWWDSHSSEMTYPEWCSLAQLRKAIPIIQRAEKEKLHKDCKFYLREPKGIRKHLDRLGGVLEIIGICGLMAFSIVLVITFYTAFFSDYRVAVYVNSLGEAWIEAVLIPILFVSGIVCFFRVLIRQFKELNRKETSGRKSTVKNYQTYRRTPPCQRTYND